MKTVGYYLDYAAQSFGVADRNSLEVQHEALFTKYLHNVLESIEAVGDWDYLKQVGFYQTKAVQDVAVTANQGEMEVILGTPLTFDAVGCELQINNQVYLLEQMVDSTTWNITPAFMDADIVASPGQVRYNRFPVPPYFKKLLNRQLIYLVDLSTPHYVVERDFTLIAKSNLTDRPDFCQVKYTSRQAGFAGECTVTGAEMTSEDDDLTPEMVGKPVLFEGQEEVYYLRSITDTDKATLDREIGTDIAVAVPFEVLPAGWKFVEVYPHPNEVRQILFDYVETEVDKIGDSEEVLASSVVVDAGIDTHLARFSEESAASKKILMDQFEDVKMKAKAKTITDYSPAISFLGSKTKFRGINYDYGFDPRTMRGFRRWHRGW